MTALDPEGLQKRTPCHKLKNQKVNFVSAGPNFTHSLDGHDKLTGFKNNTFPLAICGSIDTCSRKLLWLRVSKINSNLKLVFKWYLEHLKNSKKVSQL